MRPPLFARTHKTEEIRVSAANNLEALIKLEQNLKSQYEEKLAAKTKKIEALENNQSAQKTTIEKQLAQITQMSAERSELKRVEQSNRELTNRTNNLQKELDNLRTKAKGTQKELIEAKASVKTLKQLDAEKLKKNLISTKGKLLEQRNANELLSKKNRELKVENNDLIRSKEELSKELEEAKPKEKEKEKEETNTAELETEKE